MILNGYDDIDNNIFVILKEDSMTRGYKAALVKPCCRLDKRKFSERTINDWNNLSHDCVNASSVKFNMFENKIDIIWQGRAIPRLNT